MDNYIYKMNIVHIEKFSFIKNTIGIWTPKVWISIGFFCKGLFYAVSDLFFYLQAGDKN